MANYIQKQDKRDTSGGMTPNKAIRRGNASPVKKAMPVKPKQTMRRPQGR